MIQHGNNYIRWIEYGITSTLMLYVIAFFCNLKDTNVYLMIGATNVVIMALGQVVEKAVRQDGDWITPIVCGFVLLLAEFGVIVRTYLQRLSYAHTFSTEHPTATLQKIPSWTKYMIFVMFLFFSCFGFVSLYGALQGKDSNYENLERIYIILSLIAKAMLGFFIGYGAAQRQQNNI
jgi:hypothetical protein